MRTIKLITRFYNNLFLANFLVTLSCIWLVGSYGRNGHEIIGVLFWYKIIALLMIFHTTIFYSKNELYYYQNLGISKLRLGVVTSVVDFSIWLILMVLQLAFVIPGYIFNIALWSVLLIYLYIYIKK